MEWPIQTCICVKFKYVSRKFQLLTLTFMVRNIRPEFSVLIKQIKCIQIFSFSIVELSFAPITNSANEAVCWWLTRMLQPGTVMFEGQQSANSLATGGGGHQWCRSCLWGGGGGSVSPSPGVGAGGWLCSVALLSCAAYPGPVVPVPACDHWPLYPHTRHTQPLGLYLTSQISHKCYHLQVAGYPK